MVESVRRGGEARTSCLKTMPVIKREAYKMPFKRM